LLPEEGNQAAKAEGRVYLRGGAVAASKNCSPSLRGALATKQSILSFHRDMDCFAALAMTAAAARRSPATAFSIAPSKVTRG
jgi:hypothetical protein